MALPFKPKPENLPSILQLLDFSTVDKKTVEKAAASWQNDPPVDELKNLLDATAK